MSLIARGGGMQERALEQQKQIQESHADYLKAVAGSQGGGSASGPIASAKSLLDSGASNQVEYDQLRAKALASLAAVRQSD